MGAPWPLPGVHVSLHLQFDTDRWSYDVATRRRRSAGITAALDLTPRRADPSRKTRSIYNVGGGGGWSLDNVREKLPKLAAKHGNLGLLQWAAAQHCPLTMDVAVAAASHGHVAILQWLRAQACMSDMWRQGGFMSENVVLSAAEHGHASAFEWALRGGLWDPNGTVVDDPFAVRLPFRRRTEQADTLFHDQKMLAACIKGGSVVILRLLLDDYLADRDMDVVAQQGEPIQCRLMSIAAAAGHVHVLEWMRNRAPPCEWNELCWRRAAARAEPQLLDVLCAGNCPAPASIVHKIYRDVACGVPSDNPDVHFDERLWRLPPDIESHSDPVVRIFTHNTSTDIRGRCSSIAPRTKAADEAAAVCLDRLLNSGLFPLPTDRGVDFDADDGSHDRKLPHACELAAASGSVRCLEWLHTHGWHIGRRAAHFAAAAGSLPVLRYLHSVGFAFDLMTWRWAKYSRDAEYGPWIDEEPVTPWLEARGCPVIDLKREKVEKKILEREIDDEISEVMPGLIAQALAQLGRTLPQRSEHTFRQNVISLLEQNDRLGFDSRGWVPVSARLEPALGGAVEEALEDWDSYVEHLNGLAGQRNLDISNEIDELQHAMGLQELWHAGRDGPEHAAEKVLRRWQAWKTGEASSRRRALEGTVYENRFG